MTKEAVLLKVRRDLTLHGSSEATDRMLSGTIYLAARLLSMVRAGPLDEIYFQDSMRWESGSLHQAIHAHFNKGPDPHHDDVRLSIDLTSRNIEHDTNIKVTWKDNLLDHLRLVNGDTNLLVFHHRTFLRQMEENESTLYPKDPLREMLDTLIILFPSKDSKIQRWLDDSNRSKLLDTGLYSVDAFKCAEASRRLKRFYFWRDRLSALREVVNDARSPLQSTVNALNDRQQGDRWMNSWVAIVAIGLTLFFGLVQSVEGALQVYKSYHPTTE